MRYAKVVNLKDANGEVRKDANNNNESVFRFFVMVEIMKRDACARCRTEWNKYDLVVTTGEKSVVVEFKFYFYNRKYDARGDVPMRWKGGPGSKNSKEFRDCLDKLRNPCDAMITGKYLVYQKGKRLTHKHHYDASYGDLTSFRVNASEEKVIDHHHNDYAVCKLITVECPG